MKKPEHRPTSAAVFKPLIITFLIFALMAYTLFSLFCFLICREKRQREMSTVNCR